MRAFRILLSIFLFISNYTFLQAQARNFHVGLKGGINLSLLYQQKAAQQYPYAGFSLGVFLELPVKEYIRVQPEIMLNTKGNINGYKPGSIILNSAEGEARVSLVYLELPLLVKVLITKNIAFHAGPYVGYLLGTDVSLNDDVKKGSGDIQAEHFNRWDMGLAVGVGLYFDTVTIGTRYSFGLNNIADDPMTKELFGNGKNSVIQGFVSISF